jgi:hypothetical protein
VLSFSLYIETPSNALNAPNDILELHLSDQILWKHTAGKRPPQPEEEREYFEMLWRHNFAISNVEYNVPKESLIEGTSSCPYYEGTPNFSSYNLATDFMATDAEVAEVIHRLHAGVNMTLVEKTKPQIVNKKVKGGSNEDLTVLIKGDNAFATTFSKSFDRVNANGYREVDTVNISVASYRVVEVRLLLVLYIISEMNHASITHGILHYSLRFYTSFYFRARSMASTHNSL